MTRSIVVRDACEHNLRHVDVTIPRDAIVVVTGVSGSGKSSLVMDEILPLMEAAYGRGERPHRLCGGRGGRDTDDNAPERCSCHAADAHRHQVWIRMNEYKKPMVSHGGTIGFLIGFD